MRTRLFFLSTAMVLAVQLCAQQIQTEFGKNRVQYTDDMYRWTMYETENYITYWYGKGRNIAQSAIQIAEKLHPEIQNLVEHRINDKIEIIVYTDISDLLQSNIGNEEIFETRDDFTKVIGSRVFLYFDGNHRSLERRIKEGVAQVYLNAMYAQGSLQEVVDSEPDLRVPSWYQEGFASYVGASWDPLIEDELRDIWYQRNGKFRKFDRLSSRHPRVAGHSMWHYIATTYGRTSVTTLLYLMRLRDDIDDNLEFIFGFNEKKLKKDWRVFYEKLYSAEKNAFVEADSSASIQLRYKKWWPKSMMRLSPDGSTVAYAVNNQGKYQLVLRDLATGEQKVLFRFGSKNAVQQPDYNYPIVAWHPTRPEITVAYERRDIIRLRRIDLTTETYDEQDIPENFQRFYQIDYLTDDSYVINGVTEGYSDLYVYRSRSRQSDPLTEDYHDDIDANYVQLGEQWGVLFASNRPQATLLNERLDTILPTSKFDIYFLPVDSDVALRLTNTPDINERQPKLVNGNYLAYLSDESGVNNVYALDLSSRRPAYPITNLDRNVINMEGVKSSDRLLIQQYSDGAYEIKDLVPRWSTSVTPHLTAAADSELRIAQVEEQQVVPETTEKEIETGDKFQSRYSDPEVVEPLEQNIQYNLIQRTYNETYDDASDPEVIRFYPSRAVAARRMFKLEDFAVRADNTVLFEGLQSYANQDAEIEAQQTGVLVKGVVKDLFEDWKIELGMRVPTTFNGSEFFAVLDDRRRRIDRRYALYRRQQLNEFPANRGEPNVRQRETSFIALHRLSYPFDTYRSVRLTGQVRVDETFFQHTTDVTAALPEFNEKRFSLKAEYVFDNTLGIDLNLRHGSRYKAYVEFINRFDLEVGREFNFEASRGTTTVVGFDARHYQPILRNSILAFRGAGATSFGSDKILYYVGGTDGWITPTFDQSIPVPQDENFAFKTIAPNLRGFDHNIRNGRSFMVGSAELRIPLFKYLSARELRSKFLRNIQATAFFDIGSAWHGFLPSIEDNPINTVTLAQRGVIVSLNLDRSTFVYSYGFGARINLLGYFIRADYAWGVESGLTQDPKLHISLGTDF
ncbi:MAG: BamA/TamA family outer membrane protein [Bacteroidota bacterium]